VAAGRGRLNPPHPVCTKRGGRSLPEVGPVRMRHASKRATMRISSFSIAMDDNGRIAAHHIECPEVRKMAKRANR
jgi:hypothetical protein